MKKTLSILLSIVMLLSITAGLNFSAYANTSGDYEYEVLDDGTAEITKYVGSESELVIPSIISGYSVKSIGVYAFYQCKSLTSVVIPNSVTWIGDYSFSCCENLAFVTIGNSVTHIDYAAFKNCINLSNVIIGYSVAIIERSVFYGCENLTSIIIPNSVTNIGDDAFSGCSSLTSVTIGNSVTSIGDCVFENCESLTSITIPNSVTSIGDAVFIHCTNLTNVTISNNVTSIGQDAFYCCESLTSITIPNSVTSIGDNAFSYCKSLSSVTIPNNVISIGDYAFSSCNSLISVRMPNSVASIGDYVFYSCNSLTSVTMPNKVTSMGGGIFCYCDSLTAITVNSDNESFLSLDGTLLSKDTMKLIQYPVGNTRTSYIIPNTINYISDGAFAGCMNLTSITIPNSVKVIDYNAFDDCGNIKDVYYIGTTDEWNDIEIKAFNYVFGTAKIHYLDKTSAQCTNHTYKTTTTKATTKKNGSIVTKCSVCGISKKTTIYYPKTISLSATSYTYNGKVKKPSVTVKDSKGKKISSKYYTVSYSKGRKNVGQYTVTVKFKGNYSGTVKKTFTIKPKATTISKVTAGKKAFTVKWKKQATQTTGYQIQYSTSSKFKGAKTVTVSKNKTTSKKISKLKVKKKYYVRIRTYKTVKVNGKNTKIYSGWSKVKSVKTK